MNEAGGPMTNHILILITLSLTPFMIFFFGYLFEKKLPRDINYFFGYRTTRSMKNKETWLYAHKTVGRYWFYGGMVLEVFVTTCYLVFAFLDENPRVNLLTFLFMLPLFYLFFTIVLTELALKKRFDIKEE